MAVLNNPHPKTLDLVSLRFCAIVLGMNYGQTTALLRKKQVDAAVGPLRRWADVFKNLRGRIIAEKCLGLLLRHVDPRETGLTKTELPKPVMDSMRKAWKKLGVPGSELLIDAPPAKRGRPPQERAEETLKVQSDEEEETTSVKLEKAKLLTHQSNAEFRQLQARRLSGLMCDRNTVRSGARTGTMLIARWAKSLPAMITGKLVKRSVLTDAELRLIERDIEDSIPGALAELRQEWDRMEIDAAQVASTNRYGERDSVSMER